MAKWTEKSDDTYDKKHGIKEGSKRDLALDKKRGIKDDIVRSASKNIRRKLS